MATIATAHAGTAGALPHPLLRATALSSAIGLVAGLAVGLITQAGERDRG